MIPMVIPEVIRFIFESLLIPLCHFPCVISNLATIIFKLQSNSHCINKNMKRARTVQIFTVPTLSYLLQKYFPESHITSPSKVLKHGK